MSQIDDLKAVLACIVLGGAVFEKSSTYSSLPGVQAFLIFNATGIDGKVEYHFAVMCRDREELVGIHLENNILVALTNTRKPGSCFITAPTDGSVEERALRMKTSVLNYNWRLMNIILPITSTKEY